MAKPNLISDAQERALNPVKYSWATGGVVPDERMMPAAERAAYANGWMARQCEVDELVAEVERLRGKIARSSE
jgi:hypothetical protein